MATEASITIKDYLPLIGVIIGGVLAILGGFASNLLVQWLQHRRKVKNLALAFYGEITALRTIIEKRGYVDGLKNTIEYIRKTGQPLAYTFKVRREYFSVWKSNVSDIGILPPPLPANIARFYTQANSILEDFQSVSDGIWSHYEAQERINLYEELLELFQDTVTIADSITSEIENKYKPS